MNMKRVFRWAWLGLFIITAGCAGEDLPAPAPTVVSLTIDITPNARPVIPALNQCAAQVGGLEVVLEERFPEFFDADMSIQVGEPEQAAGFAAQIAQEELAVIVNPQNPVTSLTTDEIQRLFSGQIVNWSQLGGDDAPVAVWVPLDGDNTRLLFEKLVMDGFPIASSANLAPDPAAMQQAVGGNPYAIGYTTNANLTSSDLNPILLGVRLPVLVLADSTPQDIASQMAACLQTGSGQELLSDIYP